MKTEDLTADVARVVEAVSHYQHAVDHGRRSATAEKQARAAVKALLKKANGREPTEDEMGLCMFYAGMV